MEERPVQIQTFVGYEREISDAIKNAQKAANNWLGYHKMTRDRVEVSAQTTAEVIPSRDHIFYLYIITITYS